MIVTLTSRNALIRLLHSAKTPYLSFIVHIIANKHVATCQYGQYASEQSFHKENFGKMGKFWKNMGKTQSHVAIIIRSKIMAYNVCVDLDI